MLASNLPTIAHFELSIDGEKILNTVYLTSFEVEGRGVTPLRQSTTTNSAVQKKKTPDTGRTLLAHELTHVIQQCAGASKVRFRLRPTGPKLPGLNRLRTKSSPRHMITAFGGDGRAVAGFTARPVEAKEDVLQQEWSLTYEAIQRVH